MIGYTENIGSSVYPLYNKDAGQALVSIDVIFHEDVTATGSWMRPDTNSRTNENTVVESTVKLALESAAGAATNTILPPQTRPNKRNSEEPLPMINPGEGEPTGQTYARETIVVQPSRLSGAWGPKPAHTTCNECSSRRP